jgi:signal transduction histidine kinase
VTFGERPLLILFVLPIIIVAYIGGLAPGLLATAIACGGVRYWFIPPKFSFAVAQKHDLAQWYFLVVNGVLISALNEALHRAWQRVEDARRLEEESAAEVQRLNAELEQRVQERTAELQAANQELEGFAYAVSHDLRAPLRALSGFSQALREDCGDQLTGEAPTYLAQLELASRRMGELIDGLLTLARVTRGDLQRDVVDLTAVASRVREELSLGEPERSVDWQIAPALTCRGDARLLEVMLQNLLGNALKYSAGRDPAVIRVYTEATPAGTVFCVADNGAGFDMAHAAHLFRPFARLHRDDEFPGLGIGLATVQRIVHRHGGRIWAESAVGQGAVFRFTLAPGEEQSVG